MNTVFNFILGGMLGYLVVKEITKDPHSGNHQEFTSISSLHTSKSSPMHTDHNTKNGSHRIAN